MRKVNLADYKGREQAYIKHCLLEEYLPDWGWKVGSQWDSLVYVDGFAGPWETHSPDFADSSFGVAISVLERVEKGFRENRSRNLGVQCVLVERDKRAFERLRAHADTVKRPGFGVTPLQGQFVRQLPAISKIVSEAGENPFKFVFLDPKGWADIPMEDLAPFLNDRSCEVLINLMTRHIIRFLDEPDRAASYRELFGRPEVLPLLQAAPNEERADLAVREYCRSLQLLCGFKYVSSAVILEPEREDKRYFLVYATNHPRGVEVFKTAENKAAQLQDEVRHEAKVEKTRQSEMLFGETPKSPVGLDLWRKYCAKAKRKVIELLLAAKGPVHYSDLFCEAMAFPLVTPTDLKGWITGLGEAVEFHLPGSGRRREPSPAQQDTVTVKNRGKLEKQLGLGASA